MIWPWRWICVFSTTINANCLPSAITSPTNRLDGFKLRPAGQRGAPRQFRRHRPGRCPAGALVLHEPTLWRHRPAAGAAQLDRDHVRISDAAAVPALLSATRCWTRRPGKRWRSRSPTAASAGCRGGFRSLPLAIWTSTRPINTRPLACRRSD